MTLRGRGCAIVAFGIAWAMRGCLAAPGYECTADEQCDRDVGSVCELSSGQCVAGDGDAGDDAVDPDRCVVSVIAGGQTTCVRIADDTVWCWGDNDARLVDPLDDRDAVSTLTMPHADTAFQAVALGAVGCGLTTDDAFVCWGQRAVDFDPIPTEGAGALAVGNEVLCVGSDDGRIVCAAEAGSDTSIADAPTLSSSPDTIGIGQSHACALVDGTVTCWGDQSDGRLGNGVDTAGSGVATVPLPAPATALSVSLRSTCAIVAGEVLCWGNNENATLGVSGGARVDPNPVDLAGAAQSIAAGAKHMCAVLADASVWCWGDASSGAVDGTRGPDKAPPTRVPGVASLGSISGGQGHTCAIAGDASIVCWGANDCGELAPEQSAKDCSDAGDIGEPRTTQLTLCAG